MGKEVEGALRIGKERHQGKILLETSEILLRGKSYRLKITFAEIKEVKVTGGDLKIVTTDGDRIFEVGDHAEKWREKILRPKSRAEKLGVKSGTSVRLAGNFEPDFLKELKSSKAEVLGNGTSGPAQLTLAEVNDAGTLSSFGKLGKKLKAAEVLWAVYPKGKKEITENDVIGAGRKAGLKDVKVVGFSPTHTALKFVLPLDKR